jgi:DNA-binding SARP family transcriptional activator
VGRESPGAGLNALRHHVSRLRKAIGSALVTKTTGYCLDLEQEAVDAFRFARLARQGRSELQRGNVQEAATCLRCALALCRGDPLAELVDHEWARRETSRLEELYVAAVEDRIEASFMSAAAPQRDR